MRSGGVDLVQKTIGVFTSERLLAVMADEMVLQAQKWVNSTYRNVSGYNPVTEDGKTGWNAMYSLTRALQHELGITALSNAFGPTTLSRLQARGAIKVGESNKNIVKIIQCGMYCKGYSAGAIDGEMSEATRAGIDTMMRDIGLVPCRAKGREEVGAACS